MRKPTGTGIRIDVQIVDAAGPELKAASRKIVAATRRGIKTAGEKAILPHARHVIDERTPVSPGQLVVKTTTRDGYLTVTRRKDARKVGYLNYGGKLKAVEPKKRKAIAFKGKDGRTVIVRRTAVRKHEGGRFLEKAVEDRFPQYRDILLEEIMAVFGDLEHTP